MMALNPIPGVPAESLAQAQQARVAREGLANHPHVVALSQVGETGAVRDLVDAVHLLCQLYGRYPGLLDIAVANCTDPAIRPWLAAAAEAFEAERHYLLRLTAAVGPLPSTPGAADTEAAMVSQRHALETLAASERTGCALGAATALVAEWRTVRPLLDRAASRVNLAASPSTLPDAASVAAVIDQAPTGAGPERALAFGGQQMLLQHRALFDLLEARAEAREGY